MGEVAQAFQEATASVEDTINRSAVLSGVVTALFPVFVAANISALQSAGQAASLVEASTELKWYSLLHPYTIFGAAMLKQREKEKIANNKRAEMLDVQMQELKESGAGLVAAAATGELSIMGMRLAATYAGNRTFVVDSRPPEWRMMQELYRLRLVTGQEWQEQRKLEANLSPSAMEIADSFVEASESFRGSV